MVSICVSQLVTLALMSFQSARSGEWTRDTLTILLWQNLGVYTSFLPCAFGLNLAFWPHQQQWKLSTLLPLKLNKRIELYDTDSIGIVCSGLSAVISCDIPLLHVITGT